MSNHKNVSIKVHSQITSFVGGQLDPDMHAKRISSISDAVIGVMNAKSLSVSSIGEALAFEKNLEPKHAKKQVDRLLSNVRLDVWLEFGNVVPQVVGGRKEIVVAMDWTDFDHDDQSTLTVNMVTRHGRATPMLWISVFKDELKDNRNSYEDLLLWRLADILQAKVTVTVLADRGFGDHKLFEYIEGLGFFYAIRFRGNIHVTAEDGKTLTAAEWVGKGGRARKLDNARVTASAQYKVGAVVCVREKGMKDAWCIATNIPNIKAKSIICLYSKRWTIEPHYRDVKDPRFGKGLSDARIQDPERRDRLLFIVFIAIVILTLLGAVSEKLGMDRLLKSNTVKRRTHSLLRQGLALCHGIRSMEPKRLRSVMKMLHAKLLEHGTFVDIFAII